jgi:hypothetical protein
VLLPLGYGFRANVAMTENGAGRWSYAKSNRKPPKTVWENRMERDEISASLDELTALFGKWSFIILIAYEQERQ